MIAFRVLRLHIQRYSAIAFRDDWQFLQNFRIKRFRESGRALFARGDTINDAVMVLLVPDKVTDEAISFDRTIHRNGADSIFAIFLEDADIDSKKDPKNSVL